MENLFITGNDLNSLTEELLKQNWNVISPSEDNKSFKTVDCSNKIKMNPEAAPTKISFKENFFPRTETLFYFKSNQKGVELIEPRSSDTKTIIFGAKPCDAASVPILSKVFNWDYRDDFFNQRVENTIIIGLACGYSDEYCFCNSVGLNPNSEKGSDIFLEKFNDGSFEVKVVTEKGKDFIESFKNFFSQIETCNQLPPNAASSNEKRNIDYANIKNWLDNNFDNKFWNSAGELCLGCGLCAFVCPTCHCFDIIDENYDLSCGRRAKNWDSCQFELFTKHASGHNPRDTKEKRYRQRIMHKFKYYNDRFGEILCTGCGRCSRGCPAGINITEILENINSISSNIIETI